MVLHLVDRYRVDMTETREDAVDGGQRELTYFERRPAFVLLVGVALLAVIGASYQPVEYYDFLRAAIVGSGGFIIFHAASSKHYGWIALGAAMAIIWAPVTKLGFERSTWQLLDVLLAVALVVAAVTIPRGPDGEQNFFGTNFAWWKSSIIAAIVIMFLYSAVAGDPSGVPAD